MGVLVGTFSLGILERRSEEFCAILRLGEVELGGFVFV